MLEIVEFKSISEYFSDEKEGLKNHTERIIDIEDKRFQILMRAWKDKKYPLIRINRAETHCPDKATELRINTMDSFVRYIRHIAIWNNMMCITWDHKKDDETMRQ